eukprot:m.38380 g.38380  ORF g.38380 m.38380 type:complete len:184 (+) comp10193_c0_seq1:363-914(+)
MGMQSGIVLCIIALAACASAKGGRARYELMKFVTYGNGNTTYGVENERLSTFQFGQFPIMTKKGIRFSFNSANGPLNFETDSIYHAMQEWNTVGVAPQLRLRSNTRRCPSLVCTGEADNANDIGWLSLGDEEILSVAYARYKIRKQRIVGVEAGMRKCHYADSRRLFRQICSHPSFVVGRYCG